MMPGWVQDEIMERDQEIQTLRRWVRTYQILIWLLIATVIFQRLILG